MIINGALLSEVLNLNILKYRIGHTYVHIEVCSYIGKQTAADITE